MLEEIWAGNGFDALARVIVDGIGICIRMYLSVFKEGADGARDGVDYPAREGGCEVDGEGDACGEGLVIPTSVLSTPPQFVSAASRPARAKPPSFRTLSPCHRKSHYRVCPHTYRHHALIGSPQGVSQSGCTCGSLSLTATDRLACAVNCLVRPAIYQLARSLLYPMVH